MLERIPFIRDPLVFLQNKAEMLKESGPLMKDTETEQKLFSEYRGSLLPERNLPWLDVDCSIFIIVNKWPGEDIGIALDYRTGIDTPRVVGGNWNDGTRLTYCEISSTFSEFVELLGI